MDFSFEKTNSAYMLFYEWRSNKGGNEQRDQCISPTSSSASSMSGEASCSSSQRNEMTKMSDEATTSIGDQTEMMSTDGNTNQQTETESCNLNLISDATADCDIENKSSTSSAPLAVASLNHLDQATTSADETKRKTALVKQKRKSLLNRELEEWIWQDNRNYLVDRNIFEHTYFK